MSELTNPDFGQLNATTMMRYDANKRSTGVAYLLWFFLGGLGVHRFYLRRTASAVGILALAVATAVFYVAGAGAAIGGSAGAGGFLVILAVLTGAAVGIWLFVDVFLIPGMTRSYNNGLIAQLSGPASAAAPR